MSSISLLFRRSTHGRISISVRDCPIFPSRYSFFSFTAANLAGSRSMATIASPSAAMAELAMPTPSMGISTPRRIRLPSVLMRSGTSRGLFLHRHDLPPSESDWAPILISAMGSRSGDKRQLEGVGGGTSTTSKVVVVNKSQDPYVDVEYTFIQVAVGSEKVDMAGNCGNMASGVAAFALDEALVRAEPGQTEISVRILNLNTGVRIVETIQVDPTTGLFREDGQYAIAGVKGTGSLIKVKFMSPGGAMTGKVFPSSAPQEILTVPMPPVTIIPAVDEPVFFQVRASLVDVSNPFVFVDRASLPPEYFASGDPNSDIARLIIESIRQEAAVRMGLATTAAAASLVRGVPKIAVLSPAPDDSKADIHVLSYSMGKVHPSFQLTGAVCLGAALSLPGTVASDLYTLRPVVTPPLTPPSALSDEHPSVSLETNGGRLVIENQYTIEHATGVIDVEVETQPETDGSCMNVTVYRTAKRVFEGVSIVTV